MNNNEEIIILSDDENDIIQSTQSFRAKLNDSFNCLSISLPNIQVSVRNKKLNQTAPEIVDLEDYTEKSSDDKKNGAEQPEKQKNSAVDIIEIQETPPSPKTNEEVPKQNGKHISECLPADLYKKCKRLLEEEVNRRLKSDTADVADSEEVANENLKFFTEFVDHCGSLEKNPNDRMKLTKKLMKRYGEADCIYIKSNEFKDLIEKCRKKVCENNLYVVAKEISDQLHFKKIMKTTVVSSKPVRKKTKSNSSDELTEEFINDKAMRRKTKIINKIVKKLNQLGEKIRELEEAEVDLSDEENSNYVRLQRFRERFTQIYTKLCKFTDDVSDAERVFCRKICFTESKYPAINKCIENWLNKTKRFPDFSDIMKLLEKNSATVGLSSDRDSIREIATEIFRQVGSMLQRRRMYDLWDSFSGYLEDKEDPANNDPILEKVLKQNYEFRVKKEQEIFQRFVELQEKQKLEPEEVPDGEEDRSPADSGNEDEEEIKRLENNITKKMDSAIKKMTEFDDKEKTPSKAKETKNNYKNCKSLKYRKDSEEKVEKAKEEKKENKAEDSDLEIIDLEEKSAGAKDGSLKRKNSIKMDDSSPVKKIKLNDSFGENFHLEVDVDGTITVGKPQVFEVRTCQVFVNNPLGKDKVFKDLTNINQLMKKIRKKKNKFNLFSPVLDETFRKYSKKQFKMAYDKCVLNPENGKVDGFKSNSNPNESVEKNSENGESEKQNEFPSGQGNGDGGNNDDDKKKKDGDDESHHEEEEEEVEKENENETDCNDSNEKTDNTPKKDDETFPENEAFALPTPEEVQTVEKEMGEAQDENDCFIPTVVISDDDRSLDVNPKVETERRRTTKRRRTKKVDNGNNKKTEAAIAKLNSGESVTVSGDIFKAMRQKLEEKQWKKTSDDERVKRFLEQSPSSISITPPKKRRRSKPLTPAAKQAFETLKNLKDISTTIVKNSDDSSKRNGRKSNPEKRTDWDLPGTSSWQTMTPQIITVEGNASGFDVTWSDDSDSSSIKISQVWGSPAPDDVTNKRKKTKKNTKKSVEYVVLE